VLSKRVLWYALLDNGDNAIVELEEVGIAAAIEERESIRGRCYGIIADIEECAAAVVVET
jgi:hypothetical protein